MLAIVGFIAVAARWFGLRAAHGTAAIAAIRELALAQIKLRRTLKRSGGLSEIRLWLVPWLSYAAIAAIGAVVVTMASLPEQRVQFWRARSSSPASSLRRERDHA